MHFCYEGVKAKIETGSLSYTQSPEIMWIIYFLIALSTPISILILRKFLTSGTHVDDDDAPVHKVVAGTLEDVSEGTAE